MIEPVSEGAAAEKKHAVGSSQQDDSSDGTRPVTKGEPRTKTAEKNGTRSAGSNTALPSMNYDGLGENQVKEEAEREIEDAVAKKSGTPTAPSTASVLPPSKQVIKSLKSASRLRQWPAAQKTTHDTGSMSEGPVSNTAENKTSPLETNTTAKSSQQAAARVCTSDVVLVPEQNPAEEELENDKAKPNNTTSPVARYRTRAWPPTTETKPSGRSSPLVRRWVPSQKSNHMNGSNSKVVVEDGEGTKRKSPQQKKTTGAGGVAPSLPQSAVPKDDVASVRSEPLVKPNTSAEVSVSSNAHPLQKTVLRVSEEKPQNTTPDDMTRNKGMVSEMRQKTKPSLSHSTQDSSPFPVSKSGDPFKSEPEKELSNKGIWQTSRFHVSTSQNSSNPQPSLTPTTSMADTPVSGQPETKKTESDSTPESNNEEYAPQTEEMDDSEVGDLVSVTSPTTTESERKITRHVLTHESGLHPKHHIPDHNPNIPSRTVSGIPPITGPSLVAESLLEESVVGSGVLGGEFASDVEDEDDEEYEAADTWDGQIHFEDEEEEETIVSMDEEDLSEDYYEEVIEDDDDDEDPSELLGNFSGPDSIQLFDTDTSCQNICGLLSSSRGENERSYDPDGSCQTYAVSYRTPRVRQ